MKLLHISDLVPGMVTAEAVKTKNNQTIVDSGVTLSKQNISRMKFYKIEYVRIEQQSAKEDASPNTPEAVQPANEIITKKAPADAVLHSASKNVYLNPAFQQSQLDYATAVDMLQKTFHNIVFCDQKIDEEALLSLTSSAFGGENTTLHLFDMLHNMRQINDSIFAHSINVAVIARSIGKWLKFSKEDIDCLTLCGLLHDIGKALVPSELLNKPGKLTEQEFAQIRRHPLLGFERLKNEEINPRIKKSALMHHERSDGSGYPHNLKDTEIHPFAQIVAIADVYDAMTSSRSYRSPLCPFQVIDNFESDGLHKYNTKFMLTFLEQIANTYQNNRVILNDGRSGTIVMLNRAHLSRPIIQLGPRDFIDLTDNPSLYIKAVL